MAARLDPRPAVDPLPAEAPSTVDVAGLLRRHFAGLHGELEHTADRERAVHRARRHLKSMRGLVRLAWPKRADRSGAIADIDQALKTLADHLAPARDERVAARTADDLAARCDPDAARWLAALARSAHEAARRGETSRAGRARHKRAIAAIDAGLADLSWPRKADDLAASLARWHRRARRRLGEALASGEAEDLHAARAAVVRVLVQLEALGEGAGRFARRRRGLDRLRAALGEHHDLALLARRIEAAPASEPVRTAVLKSLARRQHRLVSVAARLHARWHGPAKPLGRKVRRHLEQTRAAGP